MHGSAYKKVGRQRMAGSKGRRGRRAGSQFGRKSW
jgi:hypothetical protein